MTITQKRDKGKGIGYSFHFSGIKYSLKYIMIS